MNQIANKKIMKRINYKIFTIMLLTAALFSSCGLNKMVRNYDEGIRYTPETNPLENHGGQVAADVTGTISEGYFQRNAVLELTPVLKYEGGEQELSTVTLRGSNTTTEGKMINRDQSTKFEMNNVIDYQPEMRESELVIRGRLYREGRENNAEELPERKVADGIINTSQRVDLETMATAIAPDEYEKETIVTQRANLYFAYMRHNINMRLPLNSSQQAQERMSNLEDFLTRGWEIQGIEINAWASPEGEVALNRSLSENRAEAGEKFLNDMINRLNRQQDEEIDHPEFEVEARGEDYDGFMAALEQSDIQDKQAIANVINSQLEPAERERKIRDMTVIYAEVEEILKPLRRAEFVVNAYEPKKTDDEILDLAQNNPSELDEEEILYAATLTDDLQTKLAIYEAAQEAFPRDYRGFNNAGAIYLEMNQVDQAAKALERANQLQPNNAYVQNNLGVVAARNGDYENARSLFESADQQQVNTAYNMGIMHIIGGDYQAALSNFSDVTCNYNVAVAQLMAGNQEQALTSLDCAPESGHVYYLKAIIGARSNDTNMIYENLRQAISEDSEFAAMAKRDREFIQYHSREEFQQVVN